MDETGRHSAGYSSVRRNVRARAWLGVALMVCAIGWPICVAAQTQSATVDQGASQALMAYLKQNRLPLVGAQVTKDSSGARRVVLYGFVATDDGKQDAEQKALVFLGTPKPTVDDRLVVKPELATMTGPQPSDAQPDAQPAPGYNQAVPSGGGAAGNAISFDSLYQQIQQYGIKSPPGE